MFNSILINSVNFVINAKRLHQFSNFSSVDDDDDIDGAPLNKSNNSTASAKLSALDSKPKFAASKWETVDEEVVKAQGK